MVGLECVNLLGALQEIFLTNSSNDPSDLRTLFLVGDSLSWASMVLFRISDHRVHANDVIGYGFQLCFIDSFERLDTAMQGFHHGGIVQRTKKG